MIQYDFILRDTKLSICLILLDINGPPWVLIWKRRQRNNKLQFWCDMIWQDVMLYNAYWEVVRHLGIHSAITQSTVVAMIIRLQHFKMQFCTICFSSILFLSTSQRWLTEFKIPFLHLSNQWKPDPLRWLLNILSWTIWVYGQCNPLQQCWIRSRFCWNLGYSLKKH